ncbi:nuclear transport factor 2 family protein [Arthrobacter sp. MA-N2]|uniref:nuclear transport factor 2 family protein n=1 Tax=Arthrobacter sp. MA-N2 TaxID=1101188 RepID=UPI0004807EED|nr:nuclear transport factor 2 family protein [Arthrobacter sp. MA-N2]
MSTTTGTTPANELATAHFTAEQLILCHYRNIDTGRATASVELFAPNAVVTAAGHTTHGLEELARSLGRREAQTERVTQHVITNLAVLEASQGRILATGVLTRYARGSHSLLERVARFEAELVRFEDSWLIAAMAPDEASAVAL